MMALDDLVTDTEEDKKESEVDEMANKLGIEDKEDLEDLDERIDELYSICINHDRTLEEIENDIRGLETLLNRIIDNIEGVEDEKNDSDDWGDFSS